MNHSHADVGAITRLQLVYQFERGRHDHVVGTWRGYTLPAYWAASPVWDKLLRYCRHRRINPDRYIQWATSIPQARLGPAPEPNQLLEAMRMDAYADDLARVRDRLRVDLVVEKNQLQCALGAERGIGASEVDVRARALTSGQFGLSPLIRYSLAMNIDSPRFERIADIFEQPALLQYGRAPDDYDAVWGPPWVVPGLRPKADWFYALAIRRPVDVGRAGDA